MTALLAPVKVTIGQWDSSYGVAVGDDMNGHQSSATDLDLEVPAAQWQPITPDRSVTLPSSVLFLDGVRRIDAHVWLQAADAQPVHGLLASLAAGLVCCDGSARVVDVKLDRSLYSSVETVSDLRTKHGVYTARLTKAGIQNAMNGVQHRLAELETELTAGWRAGGVANDLMFVDGPLFGRNHMARTVGYVKTHHKSYLSGAQAEVMSRLEAGQRTPIFGVSTDWDQRRSWYLRLPGSTNTPWESVVRLECSPESAMDEVVELADLTAILLPTLASTPHKDPRAPQNLVPIGGLERQLRHRLGDAALLYRALRATQQGL